MKESLLLVSLDFELYWGVCSSKSFEQYKENILGAGEAIPQLLELFRRHGIHATWATVGFLFADHYDELKSYFPKDDLLPSYDDPKVSSYQCFKTIGQNEEEAPCFYAPSLIKKIASTDGQEIGSHTFSHYFCKESGQTIDQFEADMQAAKRIAADHGYELQSVVLPRNQCEPEYIDVLTKLGFTAYRDEENDWIHEKVRIKKLMRLLRLSDVYFPLTGQGGYIPKKENGIWNLVGSRMYKPFFKPLSFMEKRKIKRIKKQMLHAAKNNLAFHLWWHPHNIGVKTDFHLQQLEEIFSYYDELKEKYGMRSMNMAEACAYMEKQ